MRFIRRSRAAACSPPLRYDRRRRRDPNGHRAGSRHPPRARARNSSSGRRCASRSLVERDRQAREAVIIDLRIVGRGGDCRGREAGEQGGGKQGRKMSHRLSPNGNGGMLRPPAKSELNGPSLLRRGARSAASHSASSTSSLPAACARSASNSLIVLSARSGAELAGSYIARSIAEHCACNLAMAFSAVAISDLMKRFLRRGPCSRAWRRPWPASRRRPSWAGSAPARSRCSPPCCRHSPSPCRHRPAPAGRRSARPCGGRG